MVEGVAVVLLIVLVQVGLCKIDIKGKVDGGVTSRAVLEESGGYRTKRVLYIRVQSKFTLETPTRKMVKGHNTNLYF